jgi:hypothetical protein
MASEEVASFAGTAWSDETDETDETRRSAGNAGAFWYRDAGADAAPGGTFAEAAVARVRGAVAATAGEDAAVDVDFEESCAADATPVCGAALAASLWKRATA